jgi:meckelin
MRFLAPEVTLIWVAFFIRGLGWEYLAKADPDMNKDS